MVSIDREEDTGRFAYHGGWDRLCICGHTLGVHSAAKTKDYHPCFNNDYGEDGEDCDCEKFKPAKKK